MKVCSICLRCYDDANSFCVDKSHDVLSPARPGSCEMIYNYRLNYLLEITETGETYQAVNTTNNKTYLVKTLSISFLENTSEISRQFLLQTQYFAEVNHPAVANLFESGMLTNGDLYLISEISESQTLREYLLEKGLPKEIIAVKFAKQIAEGLDELHNHGIIHRNINPDNILIFTSDENQLSAKLQNPDFCGIKQYFTTLNLSNSASNLNELRYFSPEQCRNESLNEASDVYSLGIVLYEMIHGKPPFNAANSLGLINQHLSEPLPPITITNFDIRALLTHTLTQALQKQTLRRIKTADAFARQLRHIEQFALHTPAPPPAILRRTPTKPISQTDMLAQKALEEDAKFSLFNTNKLPKLPIDLAFENNSTANQTDSKYKTNQLLIEQLENIENKIVYEKPVSAKPTLIEWEQPDDVPLTKSEVERKTLSKEKVTIDDSFFDEESFESPKTLAKKSRYTSINQVKTKQKSFPIPTRTKVLSGGIIAFLAFLLFTIMPAKETKSPATAQIKSGFSISDKPQNNSNGNDLSQKDNSTVAQNDEQFNENNAVATDDKIFENQESQSIKSDKKPIVISTKINKNQNLKETTVLKSKEKVESIKETTPTKNKETIATKSNTKPIIDKKGVVVIQSTPKSKTDSMSRPRIVKNTRNTKTAGI